MINLFSGNSSSKDGFTIVELLVVIVVIGILAAITIVSYTGISKKAIIASLQSDLNGASTQLKLYQVTNGEYPSGLDANNCFIPASENGCLKTSPDSTFEYLASNDTEPQTFALTVTKNDISYIIANNTGSGQISEIPTLSCPTGFIPVPGSITYGTADFCVMKYEAKNVADVATSQASLLPWDTIDQPSAISVSAAACDGCHLVSESEWLTIAQNVLKVPSNWSANDVGVGDVYRGNSESMYAGNFEDVSYTTLEADVNDNNGYYGMSDYDGVPITDGYQRRTLTLTNGEVIWDLSGNLAEWTSGTVEPPIIKPGGCYAEGTQQWIETSSCPGNMSPNPSAAATDIVGADAWVTDSGIGFLWSDSSTSLIGFRRGGAWNGGGSNGVLALMLDSAPDVANNEMGFRVAR